MTVSLYGLPKLMEELGELQQILGKRLAYWHTDEHPDGEPINERIEAEMGDVLAAIYFAAPRVGLDMDRIKERACRKLTVFERWDRTAGNNSDAVDGRTHIGPPAPTCQPAPFADIPEHHKGGHLVAVGSTPGGRPQDDSTLA